VGVRSEFQAQKVELLRAARVPAPGDVAALPPPIRRFAESARVGAEAPRSVVLQQRGAIRPAMGKSWSEQVYAMEPPGFLWLARAQAAPLVWIAAKDSFLHGAGNMHIRLLDLLTVASARGPEIDQAAGLRFWSEALEFPEMAASPHLQWEEIDRDRARFTVAGASPAVSGVVEFDAQGLPVAVRSERYRIDGGRNVLTPWSGLMSGWKDFDGRLFPSTWESIWHLESGLFPAVRMEILSVRTS
jgi:hypothetical protein